MKKLRTIQCKLKKNIEEQTKLLITNNFETIVNQNQFLLGTSYPFLLYNVIHIYGLLDEQKFISLQKIIQKQLQQDRFIASLNDTNINEILYFFYHYLEKKEDLQNITQLKKEIEILFHLYDKDSQIVISDMLMKSQIPFDTQQILNHISVKLGVGNSLQMKDNGNLLITIDNTTLEIFLVDNVSQDQYYGIQQLIKGCNYQGVIIDQDFPLLHNLGINLIDLTQNKGFEFLEGIEYDKIEHVIRSLKNHSSIKFDQNKNQVNVNDCFHLGYSILYFLYLNQKSTSFFIFDGHLEERKQSFFPLIDEEIFDALTIMNFLKIAKAAYHNECQYQNNFQCKSKIHISLKESALNLLQIREHKQQKFLKKLVPFIKSQDLKNQNFLLITNRENIRGILKAFGNQKSRSPVKKKNFEIVEQSKRIKLLSIFEDSSKIQFYRNLKEEEIQQIHDCKEILSHRQIVEPLKKKYQQNCSLGKYMLNI